MASARGVCRKSGKEKLAWRKSKIIAYNAFIASAVGINVCWVRAY